MTSPASLRSKLLWGISLCMVVTALTGGSLTYALFRNHLYQQLDHSLFDKLRFLRAACTQDGGEVAFDTSDALWKRLHDPEDPEYFELQLPDGTVILKSESLAGATLPEVGKESFEPVMEMIRLPSGQWARSAGQLFYPEQTGPGSDPVPVHIVVAHDSKRISLALERLWELLLIVGGITTGLLLLSTFLIVRRNLRPLGHLAKQIETIPVGDDTSRFALENPPSELNPVVRRMNALMDRVAAALENERQFTASAAHEMRNPLAAIRSQLETALSRSRSEEELRGAMREVQGIELRLERVLENLLMLAKLQANELAVSSEAIDLARSVRSTWKPHFAAAEDRQLTVSWDCPASLPDVVTSGPLLEIILRNLFDNAVSYTPEGGAIRIAVAAGADGYRVTIANTNPGLTTKDVEDVFRRFWRKSEAREGAHVHAGLGLDLCSRIAEVMGGTIEAGFAEDGLFRIALQVPKN